MRIVSLLPGITEFLFAVGKGGRVVGRSHRCDYPEAAGQVPSVTVEGGRTPPLSAAGLVGGPASEIDAAELAKLDPALVIGRPDALPKGPWDTLTLQAPETLEDVIRQLEMVAATVAAGSEGERLTEKLRTRLARLELLLGARSRPRTAVIEWAAPLLSPGFWVPGVVEAGGGASVFGAEGEAGRIADHAELAGAEPDVIVLAFAGLTLLETQLRLRDVMKHPEWLPATRAARVIAIDARAYVSRPGPRLVEGVELIAWALHRPHPVMQPMPGRIAELIEAGWVDLAAVRARAAEPTH